MYRDGEEGHIGVRIRTDMEFNNRQNVFVHDESLKLSSAISLSIIVTYPFSIIVLSKLFLRVFSASTSDGGYRLSRVRLWIGLPPSWIRIVGGPWARVWPIPNHMIEEALIWTLRDSFPTKCTDYVAESWRELFRFITAIMMRGLRRASTGTLWTRNQSNGKLRFYQRWL